MSLLQAMISAEGVKWCLIYMPSLTQSRVKEDISVDLVHVYLQVYIHVNATVPNEKLFKEYTIFYYSVNNYSGFFLFYYS